MIIIMKAQATQSQVDGVVRRIEEHGLRAHLSQGEERCIIGAIGDDRPIDKDSFLLLDGVDQVLPILKPYKLASRDFQAQNTTFRLDGVTIGSNSIVIIAGPCSVEDRVQYIETAFAVREAGAHALRGGAYNRALHLTRFKGWVNPV